MGTTPLFAAALGWVAGMRSAIPPALLAVTLSNRSIPRRLLEHHRQPIESFRSKGAAILMPLGAVAELVADKLPQTPARTSLEPLAARFAAGAVCGIVLAQARHDSVVSSALAGGVAAAAASFVMMDLRKRAGDALDIPDPAIAVLEDVLAVTIGTVVVRAALR